MDINFTLQEARPIRGNSVSNIVLVLFFKKSFFKEKCYRQSSSWRQGYMCKCLQNHLDHSYWVQSWRFPSEPRALLGSGLPQAAMDHRSLHGMSPHLKKGICLTPSWLLFHIFLFYPFLLRRRAECLHCDPDSDWSKSLVSSQGCPAFEALQTGPHHCLKLIPNQPLSSVVCLVWNSWKSQFLYNK